MDDQALEELLPSLSYYISQLISMPGRIQFLVTSLMVMACIYIYTRLKQKDKKGGIKDAFQFLFPKKVFLHKSAIVGYKYYLIDPIIRFFFFMPALQIPISVFVFSWVQGFLANTLTSSEATMAWPQTYPIFFSIFFTVLTVLLKDLGYYFQHYCMHKIPFFWEFHKTHHSASVLTPFTEWRVHPIDMLSIPYFNGILLGGAQAILDFAFGSNLSMIQILGTNAIIYIYYSIAYNIRHSHLWLSFGWHISHLFMSPAQHHVHHSTDPKHFDKNFGSILSFWDWVFGTLYIAKREEKLEFGIGNEEEKEYSSVWKLYTLPFTKNIKAGRSIQVFALLGVLAFFAVSSWVLIFKNINKLF